MKKKIRKTLLKTETISTAGTDFFPSLFSPIKNKDIFFQYPI